MKFVRFGDPVTLPSPTSGIGSSMPDFQRTSCHTRSASSIRFFAVSRSIYGNAMKPYIDSQVGGISKTPLPSLPASPTHRARPGSRSRAAGRQPIWHQFAINHGMIGSTFHAICMAIRSLSMSYSLAILKHSYISSVPRSRYKLPACQRIKGSRSRPAVPSAGGFSPGYASDAFVTVSKIHHACPSRD